MARKFYNGIDLQSQRITNVADPTAATDGANKQYIDNNLAGLRWKQPVVVATTTNGTLATAYANGQSVDGYTLVTGDRILLKNQTAQTDNGIYTVNASGAPTRGTDADSTAELTSATVLVIKGTVNADLAFTQTTDAVVIGTDNVVWVQFGGGTSYTASLGIALSGTDFRLAAAAAGAGLTLTSGVLDVVGDASITVGANSLGLATGVAGAGLTLTSGVLDVVGDASITVGANSLGLATGVAGAGLTLTSGVLDVVGTSGGGLTVNANDVGVDSTVARVFQTGTHASTTSIAITHSLGKQYVTASTYITSTGEKIECDVTATSTTVATFVFAVAPGANTITFVIVA